MSKPVHILIQKLPFNDSLGFRTFTGTKTANMRNRDSLGLSYCFSCRSFACCCLASLSRNHILMFWRVAENATSQSNKTLKFYRLNSFMVKTVHACPPNFETLCWSLEAWVWVFPKSWEREFETRNRNSEVSSEDWFQLSLEKFKPSNWNFRLRTRFSVFVPE